VADSRIDEAMAEQGRMEAQRANFNNLWQDTADRVDPAAGNFTTTTTPGTRRDEKQFDPTATIALGRATAAFESMVAPRTQKWQGLTPSNTALKKDQAVKVYLEAFRDLLFAVRYSIKANFANQNSEFIRSFLHFGNGVQYVDDDPGVSLRYKTIALCESFFAEDHNGIVDRFHRKFQLTARQLGQKFPKVEFSSAVRSAIEKRPDEKFTLIHRICTNHERDVRRRDYAGMPILGQYLRPCEQQVLEVAGFRTMPYLVSRYRVNPGEVYGRGPVMDVLASIKTVNEMQKTNLRVGQRSADPPLLSHKDGLSRPAFNMRGSHVNHGTLDEQGRPLIRPLEVGGNLPISLEMQQAEREVINDALFVTLFQILQENPNKTATQVLEEVQQRGILMSPPVGNLQFGAYGPMTIREIDLMSAIGGGLWLQQRLGDMPEALAEEGGDYDIEYDAPINKAQRAEEGIAILQTMQDAAAFAQADPSVLQVIRPREAFRRLAEIRGCPADLLVTDEEIEAAKEQAAEQAQMAQLLEAAPIVAESARNLAQANATAQTAPQAIPV
jgi:hypothetical protein